MAQHSTSHLGAPETMGFHTQSGHSQHDNFDTTVDDLFPGYFVPEDDFGMGTGVQFNDDLGFVMNTPYSYCPEALQNTEQQQMTPGHETFMVNPNPLTFMPQGMGQGMNTLPMGVMPAASDVPRFTPEATMHANQASSYMNIGIASPHFQVAGTSTTQSSAQTHTFRAMNINTPPLHTEMAGTSMSPPSAQTHHSRLGNISTPSPRVDMVCNSMSPPAPKRRCSRSTSINMPTSGVRSACKHKKPSSAQSNTPIPMKVNMPTPGIPSGSHNNTPSSSQNDTAKPVNVNPPTPSHQATQTGITHPTPTSSNIRQPILNIKILGFLLSISSSKIDAEAYPVLQALQAITKDYDVTPPTSALPPNELPKHKRSTSIEKFCKYREIFDILIKHYQKQLYEFETKGDNGSLHTLMMMEGNAGFFSDDDRKFGQTWDKAMDVVYWDHASLVEKVIERGNLFDEWEDMERQRDRMAEGLVIVLRELQRAFQSVNV